MGLGRVGLANSLTLHLHCEEVALLGYCEAPIKNSKDVYTHKDIPQDQKTVFQVHKVPYRYLKRITQDFSAKDAKTFVGRGGFAEVYLGVTER